MPFPPARRILLCLRYGIGDVIMETPVLEALRRACAGARIDVLAAHPASELLVDDPRVDGIFTVQDWGLEHWGDTGSAEIRERLRGWLDGNFDLILDPSHAVIAVREAVRKGVVPVLDAGGAAQNEGLAAGAGGVAAIKSAVKREWGIEVPEGSVPRLNLRPAEGAFAERFLAGLSPGRPLVSLSPAASSPLKRWPLDRLAATADLLVERSNAEILFFCGSEEADADPFLSITRHPRRVRVAANLHLQKVGALLSRSSLLICNDTGLMHMGSALGLPVIATFGPTSPAVYFPGGAASMSLGGNWPCPYRKAAHFGPPDCLVGGACLRGIRSCIDAVKTEEMADAICRCRAEDLRRAMSVEK